MPSKQYFFVAITLVILIFLGKNIYEHWQGLGAIALSHQSWLLLGVATLITLLAHCWAGWVWWQTLGFLHQDLPLQHLLPVYLKTNIAKYIPGNIWHYLWRVWAVTRCGGTKTAVTISVLLEPLLMAAAALTIVLLGMPESFWSLALIGLGIILVILHPVVLNYLLKKLSNSSTPQLITRYPGFLFLAEIGFLQLRFWGFCLVFAAIAPLPILDLQLLFSAFSLGWLAGLVMPVPAGLGVFESTILVLLQPQFSPSVILSIVGLFRLVSILAELLGAGLGFGIDRQFSKTLAKTPKK